MTRGFRVPSASRVAANLLFLVLALAGLATFLYPFWAPLQSGATESRLVTGAFSGAAALILVGPLR